jgi:DNA gyrase inhibitor GyrI
MNEQKTEIVRLAPMRVASFYGYGREPEQEASGKLLAWAGPRGLLDGGVTHRVFGFNNPSPRAGSPHYGYEFWLELKEGEEDAGNQGDSTAPEVKTFAGGLFAVTRCHGVRALPDTWRALVTWLEDSRYTMVHGQCLEQHLGALDGDIDALEFALYQPIAG